MCSAAKLATYLYLMLLSNFVPPSLSNHSQSFWLLIALYMSALYIHSSALLTIT